ncbi:hypothetical protein [Leptothoe spongobia]|uniref:Uncharacterized protein n=1 Tax=Leptothoe spongobia TAU-MAC 1115 TaxID=1967444 RepID=A0A947DGS1_9CYAN|nr:hypothetical protein [Leptothoe spongobia]MBT9316293.1 hypothetical protein [Leptothoe spongobia TAU-MAC 1115]
MAFRQTYSRVENSAQTRIEHSLDMAIIINGFRMGRIQGFSASGQASPRPVTEIGSDRAVEHVPGIKMFQARIQSMSLRYGTLPKRLASVAGGVIDQRSLSSTLTNMPEFDIGVFRRGSAGAPAPQLYAPAQQPANLSGTGGLVELYQGCIIDTFERSISAQEATIMENVSIRYIDVIQGNPGV